MSLKENEAGGGGSGWYKTILTLNTILLSTIFSKTLASTGNLVMDL